MPRPSVREKIVETAVVEFHRHGFAACSVDTITKAAGVPKGSFYNHFKSKEALAAEAVKRYAATAAWGDPVDPDLSPLDALRRRFEVMRDVFVDFGYTRGCLIGNMGEEAADHSEVIRAQVLESLGGWTNGIVESIRAAQAEGRVADSLDAALLGSFVLDAWEGALVRAKVVKNAKPLDDFFVAVFDNLLH
jgi:TetR/AcrR family transcriptional regulator, transcriptional repressor for nem operon